MNTNIDKNILWLLGAAFLLQAIASLVSTLILTPMIVQGKIVESMTNISNNVLQMRASISLEMIATIGIVILGVLLYTTLKNQNRNMALVALGLYLITAAIIAVSRIAAFSLLLVSQESVITGHPVYLQTLGNLFYELQDFGYFLHMLPYTLGALIFYYLFYKSRLLPRVLILWGLIAISIALIGSLIDLFGFYNVPVFIYIPNLPFDLAIGLWLIVKSIRGGSEDIKKLNL